MNFETSRGFKVVLNADGNQFVCTAQSSGVF